jgi:hypothetical protein
MLWDESFQSWLELGVTSQPTAVLFPPEGTIITRLDRRDPRGSGARTRRPVQRRLNVTPGV